MPYYVLAPPCAAVSRDQRVYGSFDIYSKCNCWLRWPRPQSSSSPGSSNTLASTRPIHRRRCRLIDVSVGFCANTQLNIGANFDSSAGPYHRILLNLRFRRSAVSTLGSTLSRLGIHTKDDKLVVEAIGLERVSVGFHFSFSYSLTHSRSPPDTHGYLGSLMAPLCCETAIPHIRQKMDEALRPLSVSPTAAWRRRRTHPSEPRLIVSALPAGDVTVILASSVTCRVRLVTQVLRITLEVRVSCHCCSRTLQFWR